MTLTAPHASRATGRVTVAVTVQRALDFTTAGAPAYGDTTLGFGFWQDVENLPLRDDNSILVDWSFTAAGTRYNLEWDGLCNVDNDPARETFGRVSAGADAQLGDVCTVTMTAMAEGYGYSHDVELSLRHPHPLRVSSNQNSSCAFFEGGQVKCWGRNLEGQLGIGSNQNIGDQAGEMENLPYVNFGTGRKAVQVSMGFSHTCALLDNGSVKCWGNGSSRQLGMGISNVNSTNAPTGVALLGGVAAVQVSAGDYHTCAVLVDGVLKCWGLNSEGRLGDGTTTTRSSPVAVNLGGDASSVTAGEKHTCSVLTDGTLKCWGRNQYGQLGDGTTTNRDEPVTVNLGDDVAAMTVIAGGNTTCAVLVGGGLKCWGRNNYYQVGDGTSTDRDTPVTISLGGQKSAVQVSIGTFHSCAVRNDESLACWGLSDYGQVGIVGSQISSPSTVNLGTDKEVKHVGLGVEYSCAVLTDHTIKCWGRHRYGSLGAGAGSFNWGDDASEMGDNLATVPLHGNYFGEITWGNFSGTLVVGGANVTPTAPQLTEGGVTVEYAKTAATSSNCTLQDAATGEVSANEVDLTSPQECALTVTVSKSGFESQSYEISIPLQAGDLGSITWGDFAAEARLVVGGERVIPTATVLSGAQVGYTVTSAANCDLVNGETGEVRAKAVDLSGATQTCTVEITVSRLGYTSQTHTISINLQKGTQTQLAWSPGTLAFQTTDSTATLGALSGAGAALVDSPTYTVANAGATGCSFGTATSSVLSFSAAGTCTVRATAARTGYNDWTSPDFDVVVSAADPVEISWSGYSDSNVVAVGSSPAPVEPSFTPVAAAGNKSFSLVSVPADACSAVDPNNGTLTVDGVGFCYVTLTATESSQATGKITVAVTALQQLDFTNTGAPSYGDTTLGLGFRLDVEHLPTTDDSGLTADWSFSAAGTRSSSVQSGVCSVDNDSESDTFGRISAGASAQVDDVCTVTIAGSVGGAELYSDDIELTLRNPRPLQITGYHNSYCVLVEGGRVKCWGQNDEGQLGIGSNANIGDADNELGASLAYLDFGSGLRATQVVVGVRHACAVLDNGEAMCWGDNSKGQLGDESTTDRNTPVRVALAQGTRVSGMAIGSYHTCAALVGGDLKCWGNNLYGQLGNGNHGENRSSDSPTAVSLGDSDVVTDVIAGNNHTCAILSGGALKCWGIGNHGRLGDGHEVLRSSPVNVDLGERTAISAIAGGAHTCALLGNNVRCWGNGDNGRLGHGGTADRNAPEAVSLGSNGETAKGIFAGRNHTCAILNDDSLKCWGANSKGQVGIGSTTDAMNATAVDLGSNVTIKDVGLGRTHSCAILSDHTVKCWGEHKYGSLGAGAGTIIWGDGSSEMGGNLQAVPLF